MADKQRIILRLQELNSCFDRLQQHLLTSLGDEGNDIGDAANILELITNTAQWNRDGKKIYGTHESYTVSDMRQAICDFLTIDTEDFHALCYDLDDLRATDYKEVHDALG